MALRLAVLLRHIGRTASDRAAAGMATSMPETWKSTCCPSHHYAAICMFSTGNKQGVHQTQQAIDTNNTSALMTYLRTKIQMRGGPMSVAEYMQDALTSPHGGFYMNRDVFGVQGDFTTSPEISQMFGEMVGAWVAHMWSQMGRPARVAVVELGPGRGTLMSDMLRITAGFKDFSKAMEVHLVEVSPTLREKQWQALRVEGIRHHETTELHTNSSKACVSSPQPDTGSYTRTSGSPAQDAAGLPVNNSSGFMYGKSNWNNAEVTWHHTLDSVPKTMPVIFIAHEFFDALPVHQFVKDPTRGWLEKLVDTVDSNQDTPSISSDQTADIQTSGADASKPQLPSVDKTQTDAQKRETATQLQFVLSPAATPAAALLVKRRLAGMSEEEARKCDAIEVSAHGMATAEKLAQRIGQQGGAALIMDYGQDGPYKDSLMAIRSHKGVMVLEAPGTADLSAWVDFAALRQAAINSGAPVAVAGPVTQADFLLQLGIQQRLQQLLKGASAQQAEQLISGFTRLTDTEKQEGMGRTYKVMAITHNSIAEPPGFAHMSSHAPN